MPITPGRVAWYVTGRFYLDEQGQLQDLGYFLHLEGVRDALFNDGPIGEATARLTFRSAPFDAQTVTNGNISIGLDVKGDFSVYLNPAGGGDFDDPDSFSRGSCVAVFRRTSVAMGLPESPLKVSLKTSPPARTYARFQTTIRVRDDVRQRLVFSVRDAVDGTAIWGEAESKPQPAR